jgi:hypothetical protein
LIRVESGDEYDKDEYGEDERKRESGEWRKRNAKKTEED